MDILKKLQNQPESTRKIILWSIIIVIGIGLLFLWSKNFQQKLKNFQIEEFKEELKLPSLEGKLKIPPNLGIPSFPPQPNETE